MSTKKHDNVYGSHLESLGFIKSDNQPDPMRVRWVHPDEITVDMLPRPEYLGLGVGDIRHEWDATKSNGTSLGPASSAGCDEFRAVSLTP